VAELATRNHLERLTRSTAVWVVAQALTLLVMLLCLCVMPFKNGLNDGFAKLQYVAAPNKVCRWMHFSLSCCKGNARDVLICW
jgi:hypothetical protein